MQEVQKLSELRHRTSLCFEGFGANISEPYKQRLIELGLTEGRRFCFLQRLPFRGPVVIELNFNVFSLGSELASEILVKACHD